MGNIWIGLKLKRHYLTNICIIFLPLNPNIHSWFIDGTLSIEFKIKTTLKMINGIVEDHYIHVKSFING